MDFFKQLFRYFLINIIMFILYYVLNTLFSAVGGIFGISNWDMAFQITGGILAYLGFMAAHIARITDRKGYGINYLYLNSKNPADPKSAFNIFTDWKRGNWEVLAYVALMFIALTVFAQTKDSAAVDSVYILIDLLLPQTIFFKLTNSALLGFIIPVVIFYLVTAFIQVNRRRVWLTTPLSEEERMKVDPEWTPAEELPTEEEK